MVHKNNLSAKEIPFDACCFHAQQAAEKYLKAFLVAREIYFPKTHDLISLNSLCESVNSEFSKMHEPSLNLSDFSVAPRYPDAFDDLTMEDVKTHWLMPLSLKNLF
jgi:HEPN domain-containing protein